MSSLKRNLFLSVFGAAMSATVAFAADLPTPPVIEYEPETVVEIGSDWYLRGDIGYAVYGNGDVYWMDPVNGHREFVNIDIKDGFFFGAGAGIYFDQHFRADVTVDYRHNIDFKGRVACISPCTGAPYSNEKTKFSAWTLMLNGYYDFGTFGGFTPYVGAGMGIAHLRAEEYSTDSGYDFDDGSKTNFAWNLMAGGSFQVADNIKLDGNYRFLSLGDVQTSSHYTNGSSATNPVKYEDLYAHEFRVGLRYDLN